MNTSMSTSARIYRVVIASILLSGIVASANTPNTVPFSESFEGLADGASIVDTNGWYAPTNTYATATNTTYTYSGTEPIQTTHGTHVVLDTENGEITNRFNSISTGNSTWIEMMLQPTQWTDENPPSATDVNARFMAYVNTNNHLVVYNTEVTVWGFPRTDSTNRFTELTGTNIGSNDWVRLSINMDMDSDVFGGGKFFSIYLDGVQITSPYACVDPAGAFTGYGGTPGPWFLIANQAQGHTDFSEVCLSGTGYLDDFVVTNGTPAFSIMWAITASLNTTAGGSISPSGTFMVNDGVSTSITITVSNFWDHTVNIDGGAAGTPLLVTFTNVQTAHTVDVAVAAQVTTNPGVPDVPRWWLDSTTGSSADTNAVADTDGDGLLNWQEWLASTDPNDAANKFEIMNHYVTGGNYYVVWTSKAVDPALQSVPFRVLRSTNLTVGAWEVIADNVARPSGEGTTIFQDPSPLSGPEPVYYRVEATNAP